MAGEFVGAQDRSHLQRHRQDAFLRRHKDIRGVVRLDLWRNGVEHVRKMKVTTALRFGGPPGAPAPAVFAGVQWSQIGPAPIRIDPDPADPNKQFRKFQGAGPVAGEVTDIAVDPQGTEDQIIYISTNDGGIWKSTDGGTTWNPKTDGMPSLSMGAVAIDPRILRLSMPEPATSLTVEECSRKAWASIHLPTPERPGRYSVAQYSPIRL